MENRGHRPGPVTVSLVADTTVVVVAPGLGDYLQAIKSGIMEVGDIFVVNKADRDDADRTVVDLEMAIRMGDKDGWRPPVIKTIASDGTGIEALMTEIARHGASCVAEKMSGQKARAVQNEILEAVKSRLFSRFCGTERLGDESMARFTRDVCERRIDPYMVADMILAEKGIG
jgi:LAO/AO transport system kinase